MTNVKVVVEWQKEKKRKSETKNPFLDGGGFFEDSKKLFLKNKIFANMKTISDDIFSLALKEISEDLKLKKDLKRSTWKPKTKNVHIVQKTSTKLKKLSRLTEKSLFKNIYN